MSNNKSHNPYGREVLVYEGKEITRQRMEELPDAEVIKVKKRVNGPHFDSRWAIDRRQIKHADHRWTRDFNGKVKIVALRYLVITPPL